MQIKSDELSSQILELILKHQNSLASPDASSDQFVSAPHLERIRAALERSQTLLMILPAFPAKSPNPRKTVSHQPDYGEVLALIKLNDLCQKIRAIYAPGAEIRICSDGRVFSDIVQVRDGAVDSYGMAIRMIILEKKLAHLSTYSLDEVYCAHDYDLMRQRLTQDFAEDIEVIRDRIRANADALNLFNGIHRFMLEDQLALNSGRSKSWVRERAKLLAYQVIQRSNAWSRLVEQEFPHALRLSIHPQPPHSLKIGIRLMPSDDLWRTPWHSVLISDGQNFSLLPRAEAEARGGVLAYAEGKYPYYQMRSVEVAS